MALFEIVAHLDPYILVATGDPHEKSRHTEYFNVNKKMACSTNDTSLFPTKLYYAAGGVLDKRPTICGGYDGSNIRNDCWQFMEAKWNLAGFSLKTKRYLHASLVINDELIISGGYDESYNRLQSTEIIKNGISRPGPDLKSALSSHCMVSFEGSTWVIGGYTNTGEETSQTWIHDTQMNYKEDGPKLTSSRSYHGCSTVRRNDVETILVVGGYEDGSTAEYLDILTNTWKQCKSF